MRVVCLYVPYFSFASLCRVEPELRGERVAVTHGTGAHARIMALSPEATVRGLSAGLSAAQGIAIDAGLVVRPASQDAERAAQAALCDVADSCSPRVEDAEAGTVYLDCSGLCGEEVSGAGGRVSGGGTLYGSEEALARVLVMGGARVGLEVSVGIASTKMAARLAARGAGGVTVIPPGEEWRLLAPLPIRLLDPGPAMKQTLSRWGIRSLGELAALPASAVATRLGAEGALLVRRARGEDESPLSSRPAPIHFEEKAELDYAVDNLEAFSFLLRALLDRLVARLDLRGFVCGDLRLSLQLANRGHEERCVAVAAPSNDVKALLALVRLDLEGRPPPAPIETIRVAAAPERLRAAQLDLFLPPGPAPEKLSVTLARLSALCGADRIGCPVVADSHRPDAYRVSGFGCRVPGAGSRVPDDGLQGSGVGMRVALRAIRPPRTLDVFTSRDQLDFVRLVPENQPPTPDTRRPCVACTGRVVSASGPWRVQGEWWEAEGFARDYYDVQLSDGVVYRLFHDRREGNWFVDGVYD